MSLRRLRVCLAGTAIACVVIALPALGGQADAASTCAGVTVVVDFTHFNGNIERGCALNPNSGLDALHKAGFSTAGTTQYGDAFVCRIDNLPGAAQESCTSTPSATAYWSYYHAQANDTGWSYSPIGASSTHPAAGTVEGWAFGARALPGIAPKDVTAPPPPPPPTTTRPQPPPPTGGSSPGAPQGPAATTHGNGTTGPAAQGPGTSAAASRGSGATTTMPRSKPGQHATGPTGTKTQPRATHATTTTADPRRPTVVDRSGVAAAPASSSHSGRSPIGVIVTLVLLAVGAGAALLFVRARRRRSLET